jgi:hypothetical protein
MYQAFLTDKIIIIYSLKKIPNENGLNVPFKWIVLFFIGFATFLFALDSFSCGRFDTFVENYKNYSIAVNQNFNSTLQWFNFIKEQQYIAAGTFGSMSTLISNAVLVNFEIKFL